MQLFQRVMVALARSESDRQLLRYAQLLSGVQPGAVFQFVHVLDWPRAGQDPATVVNHDRARAEITGAVAREFGAPQECRVLSGSRLDRLLEFAAEAGSDLILTGHRRGRSGRRSLARRLAMQAPCSLWMVPEGARPVIRSVLAAIDFSEHSAIALQTATHIARSLGLEECTALHVFFNEMTAGVPEYEAISRGKELEAFHLFIAPLELHGIRVRPVFEESPTVSAAVARRAEGGEADLVVMGTRGKSPSASVLLGSESEQILMETRIPALVVKQRGARMGLLEALLDRELTQNTARFG